MAVAVGVIGAGGWGTSLAKLLCEKGMDVTLWSRSHDTYRDVLENRENRTYLPGISLPGSLKATNVLGDAVRGKQFLLCAVPSHGVREVMQQARPYIHPETVLVCGTKGIEEGTLLSMGEVLTEIFGSEVRGRVAFLSGPTFALEVARNLPAAATVAAFAESVATQVQELLSNPSFRVYTSHDVIGVQMGGVVKNVIAIAAGISDGLNLGYNARAALITRGLAEMTRLVDRMGGDPRTLAGLPGLGDLILTCTGDLSRNRSVGKRIAQGETVEEILRETRMVAEGVRNTRSLFFLARRLTVEMPIVEQMYLVLYEGKKPSQAAADLMQRSLKPEHA